MLSFDDEFWHSQSLSDTYKNRETATIKELFSLVTYKKVIYKEKIKDFSLYFWMFNIYILKDSINR